MRWAGIWLVLVAVAGGCEPVASVPSPAPVDVTPSPVVAPVECLVFVGTDCPISNAYAPEVGRIARDYGPRGVAFTVVYPGTDVTPEAAAKHAADHGFPCRSEADPRGLVARRVGATRVPEVAVVVPGGVVVYLGRIDDRYPAPGGKRREHPTTRDLRDALDAVLAGKPVAVPRTRPVGCPIDFPDR